jgi:hypothetical protein
LNPCHPRYSWLFFLGAKWLEPTGSEDKAIDEKLYRSVFGYLSYLAQTTRPDIEQFTFHLATFVSNPCEKHWNAVKHLLGYLKKFPNMGIRYSIPENLANPNMWKFYVDADWEGDLQPRKSTTGYIISFMKGPIITKTRQKRVALSSTLAGYVSFTSIIKDIKWLYN